MDEKDEQTEQGGEPDTHRGGQIGWRRQNSTTSSKPPSSDGLAGVQRERGRKKKSCRRPGGQLGHRGRWRGLASADRVNEVGTLFPPRCRHCERQLPATRRGLERQGEPTLHHVTRLPPTA